MEYFSKAAVYNFFLPAQANWKLFGPQRLSLVEWPSMTQQTIYALPISGETNLQQTLISTLV